MEKYYITTPIYYVNDVPHIGHAYTTVIADVLARWHRMKGDDVLYTTGTDENAQKNAEVALRDDSSDDARSVIQAYVDKMSAMWQQTWDTLGISNDDFIRTTEKRHLVGVERFFEAVNANGDIYEGTYTGLYCIGCESYCKEGDLVDGKCPDHNRVPEKRDETNYFFRASKYRDQLLKHIADHPEFVQPKSRRNEVLQYVKENFEDFSISRQATDWGIPVPGDEKSVLYVWFDALLNYLTVIGYGEDDKAFAQYWPADLHLVGKDIIKFHCAYWPAMLMSAGVSLPKTIFAHGFFTINGQKMSKSLGNYVDPITITNEFGNDALRYYLLREIPFGEDGDFSTERFAERYQADLANGIGNLVARVTTLAARDTRHGTRGTGHAAEGIGDNALKQQCTATWTAYETAMTEYRFHDALAVIWGFIGVCDATVEKEKPWTLEGDALVAVMAPLVESLRHIAWMLWPIMPSTAEQIFDRLGIATASREQTIENAKQWGALEFSVTKGDPLFPRIEKST
jgi:methionyl-tRNA synthetase